jgi:hypothetical protein
MGREMPTHPFDSIVARMMPLPSTSLGWALAAGDSIAMVFFTRFLFLECALHAE